MIAEKEIGIKNVAHSIYIQTLVEQGLLGFSILLLFIISIF